MDPFFNQIFINKSEVTLYYFLGQDLKVVTNAAEKYHGALAENRKLFNEIQELKGANFVLQPSVHFAWLSIIISSSIDTNINISLT